MTIGHMRQPPAETLGHKPSRRPRKLSLRLSKYMISKRLKGHKRFPLVTMLEPLEMCNLSHAGCGRIREYKAALADVTVSQMSEVMKKAVWERYGIGSDPRYANCMTHCGFESAATFFALTNPRDWLTLIKTGAISNSGITSS